MKILLLSDIHGNYPALEAIVSNFKNTDFKHICNCGDSTVYAPFPNETLHWLKKNKSLSILGNTDRKVKKLLRGKTFKKPGKPEKRIMYTWTAETLDTQSRDYLLALKKTLTFSFHDLTVSLFHGSPQDPDEFLFPDTPSSRFKELSHSCSSSIIITGHSHSPFHRQIGETHFINPGSVGRMFDSDPSASCAVLKYENRKIHCKHYRIPYDINKTVESLSVNHLPPIYQKMYLLGQKLN